MCGPCAWQGLHMRPVHKCNGSRSGLVLCDCRCAGWLRALGRLAAADVGCMRVGRSLLCAEAVLFGRAKGRRIQGASTPAGQPAAPGASNAAAGKAEPSAMQLQATGTLCRKMAGDQQPQQPTAASDQQAAEGGTAQMQANRQSGVSVEQKLDILPWPSPHSVHGGRCAKRGSAGPRPVKDCYRACKSPNVCAQLVWSKALPQKLGTMRAQISDDRRPDQQNHLLVPSGGLRRARCSR